MTHKQIPEGLIEWLANGERGLSSETIVQRLTGIDCAHCDIHPYDPSDLGRCRKLMERVPALRDRFSEMRDVSPQWAALVDHWDELCATMDEEAPEWRKWQGAAANTYRRMNELLKEAAP